MTTDDIEAAMDRALVTLGRPCFHTLSPANLMRPRPDGWVRIGTVTVPEERKA